MLLIIYIILINIVSFFTMWYDKTQAQNYRWRISEKSLFVLACLLGGIGIYAGMYCFRHKTKHTKFVIGIPMLIVLNIISVYYIIQFFSRYY